MDTHDHPPPHHATLFLDTPQMIEWVQRVGLRHCWTELAAYLRADFARWPVFHKSARMAHHAPQGVLELMPVADETLYSVKYVNGHPGNPALGLPTVMALGLLADVHTGRPLLLCEMTLLTALRTAAVSALAAQVLARPNSRVMALIGNGAQSEFQALAFQHLVGIDTLRVFDTDASASQKLFDNLQGSGLHITVCASAGEAMEHADIVTTATAHATRAAWLQPDWLRPGMHLNAIGGDSPGKTELPPAVLQRARVFVEYPPQTRAEGDIQQLPPEFAVTALWQVLQGRHPGRHSRDDITVFDSVGFALEDFSALRLVHDSARRLSMGTWVQLLPTTAPKNLFGALRTEGHHAPF